MVWLMLQEYSATELHSQFMFLIIYLLFGRVSVYSPDFKLLTTLPLNSES